MSAKILVFGIFVVFIEHTLCQYIRSGAGSCKGEFGITNNRISHGAFQHFAPITSSLCPTPVAASGNLAEAFGRGFPALDLSIVSANNGGSFNVQSSSPIAPSSIFIKSENAIEGALSLNGMLPFLSTVGLEGELPTFGAGGVTYRCGEGVAMLSENYGTSDLLEEVITDNNRGIINQSNGLSKLGKDVTQCRHNYI